MPDQKIADAVRFVWERPAKRPSVLPALAIIMLLVAHAGFSLFAVRLLPRLFSGD